MDGTALEQAIAERARRQALAAAQEERARRQSGGQALPDIYATLDAYRPMQPGGPDLPAPRQAEPFPAAASEQSAQMVAGYVPPRSIGETIYENVIGRGEVDTPGEHLGRLIQNAGSGAVRGAVGLAGLPGTIDDAVSKYVTTPIANRVMGTDAPPTQSPFSGAALNEGLTNVTGGALNVTPETTAEEYAQTIGEFMPGAAAFGGAGLGNLLKYGVTPAVASEAAGQATEGTAAEPYARIGAALAAPGIAGGAMSLGRKSITPNPTSPVRIRQAETLRQAGVTPTAGQVTGSERLLASEAATRAGQSMVGQQGDDFTAAAMRTTGSNARDVSPESMKGMFDDLGDEFNRLATSNSARVDQSSIAASQRAQAAYIENTGRNNVVPIIGDVARAIEKAAASGRPMAGSVYQSLRTRLGPSSTGKDDVLRTAAHAMREALDDAMERSLVARNNVDDLAAFRAARNQYRNALAIEKAATSSAAVSEAITPAALRQAVVGQGRRAYVTGRGDLNELSRAGQNILKPLPNSGTSPRIAAQLGGAGLGGGVGAGIGASLGGPAGAALGAIAGTAIPAIANAAKMTGPMQRYFMNQVLGEAPKQSASGLRGLLSGVTGASAQ